MFQRSFPKALLFPGMFSQDVLPLPGHQEKVEEILREPLDPDATDQSGRAALRTAAFLGQMEACSPDKHFRGVFVKLDVLLDEKLRIFLMFLMSLIFMVLVYMDVYIL